MPWLILGIAVVLGLVLIVRGLVGLNPRRAAKVLLGVIVIALVGITVYLVASRGIGAIIFVLAVLLPMILRWRAAKQFFQNLKGPSSGQATGIETQFLRMNLDHDSGILDGTILEGKFKGKRLSELRNSELTELLRECRVNDEQSTNADWELIAFQSVPEGMEKLPLGPVTMMRNQLELPGGTAADYSSDEWAEAVRFWQEYAFIKPLED